MTEVLRDGGWTGPGPSASAVDLSSRLRALTITPLRRAAAVTSASLVLLLGALTLAQHLFGVDLRIDQLLATEHVLQPGFTSPNQMEVAHSGPAGVEAARRGEPDIVLCDLGLPELDGYGVARAIRSDPDSRLRSTFLVALSGYALPEDVTRARQAGFDRHLAKPMSIEALEKVIEEASPRAGR